MTTTTTPEDVVREVFRRDGAGDLDGAAALFAPSVDFAIPGAPDIPWIPDADSPEGMREFFRRLHDQLSRESFDITHTLTDGDDVVLLGRLHSVVKATGRPIHSRFAMHMTVTDGLITRWHMYEDGWEVARAAGLVTTD
ncbi:nuclear transport factor 2 family protein [Saccharomonospora saliphila]|uniref:nuclear transport factor 2 family protein n=1 Tax=Saccharomonospora saliphila TaxID=369829 RepID=UPI00037FA57B|nr:nuclear transport factor 2 family protein [Saccharomonospora saliphila]